MPSPYNLTVNYNCLECVVKNQRVFCNLEKTDLQNLQSAKFTGVYPKGAILFVEGEMPRGVFMVCQGRVKLTASSSEGKMIILKIAEAGDVLGLSSSILGTPYEVSAETLEPSQINFVKREDFLRFMANSDKVALRTAEALSKKYHDSQREIRVLGLAQSATERLASLLLSWCDDKSEQTSKGIRFKVLLTHGEIAQMIGTTRETITRLLSDFRKRGILEIKGSSFFIPDRSRLEAMVTT